MTAGRENKKATGRARLQFMHQTGQGARGFTLCWLYTPAPSFIGRTVHVQSGPIRISTPPSMAARPAACVFRFRYGIHRL